MILRHNGRIIDRVRHEAFAEEVRKFLTLKSGKTVDQLDLDARLAPQVARAVLGSFVESQLITSKTAPRVGVLIEAVDAEQAKRTENLNRALDELAKQLELPLRAARPQTKRVLPPVPEGWTCLRDLQEALGTDKIGAAAAIDSCLGDEDFLDQSDGLVQIAELDGAATAVFSPDLVEYIRDNHT